MGTNDIIKSKDKKAVKSIRAMREEVLENTHFIHIPPQRTTNIADFDKMADNTRKGLNEMYDKYFDTIPFPAIEENTGMYLIRDGYHLNDDAGKYIATEIKRQLTNQSRAIMKGNLPARVITQETCYKTTVKIPKAMMKHILGTEGTKIRAINEKNGTTITNKEVRQDETIIEIKGSTDSVEETKRDIQEQLKRRERDAEMKKLCGKKQCNFIGSGFSMSIKGDVLSVRGKKYTVDTLNELDGDLDMRHFNERSNDNVVVMEVWRVIRNYSL